MRLKASLEKINRKESALFRATRIVLPVFDHSYHFHPEIELTWIENGFGWRHVGDSLERFEAGDLVLIGGGLLHLYSMAEEDSQGSDWARAAVIQFTMDLFSPRLLAHESMRKIERMLRRCDGGLHFPNLAVAEVEDLLKAATRAKGGRSMVLLMDVLERLGRRKSRLLSESGMVHDVRNLDMQRMDRVVQYVQSGFRESLSLKAVADIASMSEVGFCRFFRRSTGRTFSRYLNEVRLEAACRLLRETDHKIADVAFECGFGALSNFNRRFLEIRGMRPRDYREALTKD